MLAFTCYFRALCDNNQAERDIRMVKAKQEVSRRFLTAKGENSLLSGERFISDARKNGLPASQKQGWPAEYSLLSTPPPIGE
jgi:hypothetical protein